MAGDRSRLPNGAGGPPCTGSPAEDHTPPTTPTHTSTCGSHDVSPDTHTAALRPATAQTRHMVSIGAGTAESLDLLSSGTGQAAVPRMQTATHDQSLQAAGTARRAAPQSAFSHAIAFSPLPTQANGAALQQAGAMMSSQPSGAFGSFLTTNGSAQGTAPDGTRHMSVPSPIRPGTWISHLGRELAPNAATAAEQQHAVCPAKSLDLGASAKQPASPYSCEGMAEGGGGFLQQNQHGGLMDVRDCPMRRDSTAEVGAPPAQDKENQQATDNEHHEGLGRRESGDGSAIMVRRSLTNEGGTPSHDGIQHHHQPTSSTASGTVSSGSGGVSPEAQHTTSGARNPSPLPVDSSNNNAWGAQQQQQQQQLSPVRGVPSVPRMLQEQQAAYAADPQLQSGGQQGFGSPQPSAASPQPAHGTPTFSPLRPVPQTALAPPVYSPGTQQQRDTLLRMLHQPTGPSTPLQQAAAQQLPPVAPLQQVLPTYPGMMFPAGMYGPQIAPLMQHFLTMQQGAVGPPYLGLVQMQAQGAAVSAGQPAHAAVGLHTQPTTPATSGTAQPQQQSPAVGVPAGTRQEAAGRAASPLAARPATSRGEGATPSPAVSQGQPVVARPLGPHMQPSPAYSFWPQQQHQPASPLAATSAGGGLVTWGLPMSPHVMSSLPPAGIPGALEGLDIMPWGMAAGAHQVAPSRQVSPARPTTSHEVVGESAGQALPSSPRAMQPGASAGQQPWPAMSPAGPWPSLRVRPRPEAGMSAPDLPLVSSEYTRPMEVEFPATHVSHMATAVPPVSRRLSQMTSQSQQAQYQLPALSPAQQAVSQEMSGEEEDAAATLAGMMGSSGEPPAPPAHHTGTGSRQASPKAPRRRTTSSAAGGGAGTGAARRRSPPGGSAVWAHHPEVMTGVTQTATPTTTAATTASGHRDRRVSHGVDEPGTPVGPLHARLGSPHATQPSSVGEVRTPRSAGAGGAGGVAGAGLAVTVPVVAGLTSLPPSEIAWLEELTTTDRFFKLCEACGGGLKTGERPSNGGRDALCTLLDLDAPSEPGVCANCRVAREAAGHRMLQIRRSTYHDVVKAQDMTSLKVDLSGVQAYSINNARVVFLRPRPSSKPPKGSTMPSRCVLDGRQLMDTTSRYCCLRCKMDVELHGVAPTVSAHPEPDRPSPPKARTPSSAHRSHPATTTSGGPAGSTGGSRKRQRAPGSVTISTAAGSAPVSPGVSGGRAPASPLSPLSEGVAAAFTHHAGHGLRAPYPTAREDEGQQRTEEPAAQRPKRVHGAEPEHVLYTGDHGVLEAIPEGPVEGEGAGLDQEVVQEVAAEAARLAVRPEAVLHPETVLQGGEPEGAEEPLQGNPPFSRTPGPGLEGAGREGVMEAAAPHKSPVHHHVTFGYGVSGGEGAGPAAGVVSHPSPGLSGRTVSVAALSGHTHPAGMGAGVGEASDSRSSGSVKRKRGKVHRGPVE